VSGHVSQFNSRYQRVVPSPEARSTAEVPRFKFLVKALDSGEEIYRTGIILQELLQGFSGAKAAGEIIDRFLSPFVTVYTTSSV